MSNGNVPHARRVKFKTLVANDSGPARAQERVIDEREEYDEWIASCVGGHGDFPADFDLDKQMLLAVAVGERPTSGWCVQIVAVAEITGGFVGLQWQVLYRVRPPDGIASQVITHPQHVIRTHRFEGLVTFRRVEDSMTATTLAIGEEGPAPQPTTLAVGEEGPVPQPTTLAVGEEGPQLTTLAIGEEGPAPQPTTLAIGEEGPRLTTLAVGEEGPGPTTLAVGEESMTTLAIGEEGTGFGGGGSPFGAY